MDEEKFWFTEKKKENCRFCSSADSVRVDLYSAVRVPLVSNNEFINCNTVKKKTEKTCEKCGHKDEIWDEWKENKYPKINDSDFLKRRALYFKAHIPYMAEEGFEDFLKLKPSDHEMLYEYADFLISKNDLVSAYPHLQKSLEKKKDFLPAAEKMNDLLHSLFISQNEFWYEKRIYFGNFVKLFSSFTELCKKLNESLRFLLEYHKNSPHILSKYCLRSGNLLEDSGNFSLALQHYEYALNCALDDWIKSESCIRTAAVHTDLQDYEKAHFYLDKSFSITPNVLIYLYRSKTYRRQGEKEKADEALAKYLKSMDELIRTDLKNPKLYYFKGLGLSIKENAKVMAEFYRNALDLLKADLDVRRIFYERINYFQDPPTETVITDPQNPCPVCSFPQIRKFESRDSVAGLDNWADGINSTVYYLKIIKKICLSCGYEWQKYLNRDEREFEYPG